MTALAIILGVVGFLGLCILSTIETHMGRIARAANDLADQGRVRSAREAYLDQAVTRAQAEAEKDRHR